MPLRLFFATDGADQTARRGIDMAKRFRLVSLTSWLAMTVSASICVSAAASAASVNEIVEEITWRSDVGLPDYSRLARSSPSLARALRAGDRFEFERAYAYATTCARDEDGQPELTVLCDAAASAYAFAQNRLPDASRWISQAMDHLGAHRDYDIFQPIVKFDAAHGGQPTRNSTTPGDAVSSRVQPIAEARMRLAWRDMNGSRVPVVRVQSSAATGSTYFTLDTDSLTAVTNHGATILGFKPRTGQHGISTLDGGLRAREGVLPELRFGDLVLRRINAIRMDTAMYAPDYNLLGLDVLSQFRKVFIDLHAMQVVVGHDIERDQVVTRTLACTALGYRIGTKLYQGDPAVKGTINSTGAIMVPDTGNVLGVVVAPHVAKRSPHSPSNDPAPATDATDSKITVDLELAGIRMHVPAHVRELPNGIDASLPVTLYSQWYFDFAGQRLCVHR